MQIIDTHVHLFDHLSAIRDGQPTRALRDGKIRIGNRSEQALPPAFEKMESRAHTLLAYMDWCGVSKALLMPNPYYGYFNDYFIESIEKYPEKLKGVALVDPLKGMDAAIELQTIYDKTPLFGLKIEVLSTFQCAPQKNICSEELLPIFDCLNENHQPIFIHMLDQEDIGRVKKLSSRFPNITWILCHLGADSCFGKGYNLAAFEDLLTFCKSNEKVYLETSSVECFFNEEYPFSSSVKIIEKAYHAVGAEKMMFGSDYPGTLMLGTMPQLIHMISQNCSEIPMSDREQILSGTAKELFFH